MKKEVLAKILNYIAENKWDFDRDAPAMVYLEDADRDGYPKDNTLDYFDDWRLLIDIEGKRLIGQWAATTMYGKEAMRVQTRIGGAARVSLGFHKHVWQVGLHKGDKNHEALVQRAPINITRDLNQDGERIGDKEYTGLYGLNNHTTGRNTPKTIGAWSYGCLVGQYRKSHLVFMSIIKDSERYKNNHAAMFSGAIINAKQL